MLDYVVTIGQSGRAILKNSGIARNFKKLMNDDIIMTIFFKIVTDF